MARPFQTLADPWLHTFHMQTRASFTSSSLMRVLTHLFPSTGVNNCIILAAFLLNPPCACYRASCVFSSAKRTLRPGTINSPELLPAKVAIWHQFLLLFQAFAAIFGYPTTDPPLVMTHQTRRRPALQRYTAVILRAEIWGCPILLVLCGVLVLVSD